MNANPVTLIWTVPRLAGVKQGWDPDNLFRANHHIDPVASAAR